MVAPMTKLYATFPTEVPDALILAIVADVKNPRRLVAVGGQGWDVCLLSDDEGASFQALAPPCKGLRNAYLNGDELWVAGEYGHVAVSRDGGVSFTVVPTDASACLFGVVKDDTGALWIAGDGGLILRSVDDGASFTKVPGAKVSLSRLSFMPGIGVVIPSDNPGDLYVCSVDKKGKAKATKWAVDAGADLMVATRTKSGAIVVVGGDGFCARADGPGGDFTKVAMPTKELLTCCCTRADGAVIAVGMSGGVFCSDDDGHSFSAVDVGQKGQWWWVSALGDDVIVGGKATLMRVSQHEPAPHAEEVTRRDGVLFSSQLRRRVYPWRGVQWGVQADRPAPLPTRDAAWARLRDLFWDCTNERERRAKRGHGIWDRALAPKRGDRAVATRLRQVARQEPSDEVARAFVAFAFDDDAQATRTALLHDALADWLVAELGIVRAVLAAFAGLPGELPYSDCGVFGRLRELVAMDDVTSDSDYVALLSQMVPLLKRLAKEDDDEGHVNDLWSAASFVFPPSRHDHDVEGQLLERAKTAIGKFGNLDIAHPCLLASVDDDGFGRFLKANPESRHEMFATTRRPYVATPLARGSALFRDRVDGLRPRYDLGVFDWALMLAHIDEDRCMRVLDKHQQEKPHPGIDAALRLRAALTPSVLPHVRGARPPRALAITEAPPAPPAPAGDVDVDDHADGHVDVVAASALRPRSGGGADGQREKGAGRRRRCAHAVSGRRRRQARAARGAERRRRRRLRGRPRRRGPARGERAVLGVAAAGACAAV